MSTPLLRVVWALSLAVAAYAIVAYAAWPLGTVLHPELRPSFAAQPAGLLYAHVFAAAVALLVGPLQFSRRLRTRRPVLHRVLGRIYLGVGVLVGGVSGALLAAHAYGGPWARAGFLALALAWLATGAVAWLQIRRGEVDAHRRWMIRNFGLTLAAVALRLWLPALTAAGVPLPVAYPLVAWLCWLPHAVGIELHLAQSGAAAVLRRRVVGTLALLAAGAALLPAVGGLPASPAAGGDFVLGATRWNGHPLPGPSGAVIDVAPPPREAVDGAGRASTAVASSALGPVLREPRRGPAQLALVLLWDGGGS